MDKIEDLKSRKEVFVKGLCHAIERKESVDVLNAWVRQIQNVDSAINNLNDELINKLNFDINYLDGMLKKYDALGRDYRWRFNAIAEQLYALECVRDNCVNNWNECYEEDLLEFKRNQK